MLLPRGGLVGKVATALRRIRQMEIPDHGANAGFFMTLSVFPLLVLLIGILRYTPLDARDLMDLVQPMLPDALEGVLEMIVIQAYARTGPMVLSVSAATALWSASRGMHSVLRGLNAIYGVEEGRRWFHTRFISMIYTVALILLLLLTLAINVFGTMLLDRMSPSGRFWKVLTEMVDLRFTWMLLVQTAVFTGIYMFLPNKNNSFSGSLPGAVLASLGWQAFSALYSLYVERWAGYSNIYGSMYALALAMLWLYCCLCILFYGGALNQLLEE